MKKVIYQLLTIISIISVTSTSAIGGECRLNDAGCIRKKLAVDSKISRILKDAASSVIAKVDDSYATNKLSRLLESCDEKSEMDESAVGGGTADKALYDLTEVESQLRCYQEVLKDNFVIDLSIEAITESIRKNF